MSTIIGTSNDDQIVGTMDDDTITGGSGTDIIDGIDGIDTVIFTGNIQDYVITETAQGYTVQDTVANRDGIDTLSNIERLQFADHTIAIDGTNNAPLLDGALTSTTDDGYSTLTVNLLTGATDFEGSTLSAINFAQTAGRTASYSLDAGTLTLDPGQFTDLAAGQTAVLTFSYGVSDGTATTPQTLTVTVTGTNDAPVVAAALSASTNEDNAPLSVSLLTGASDVDAGTTLSAINFAQTAGRTASYSLNAGTFTLNPGQFNDLAAGETAVLTFSYGVSDGTATTPQTLTVTVTGTNDAPVVAAALSASTNDGASPLSIALLASASDPDAHDTLTVSGLTQTGGPTATWTKTGNTLTLDPRQFNAMAQGQVTTLTFAYQVGDGTVSVPQTLTVTINGLNDAPVAIDHAYSGTEDTALTITAAQLLSGASDPEGDSLSIIGASNASHGTAVRNANGSVTFTPTANYNGTASYSYTISDGHGGSTTRTATVNVAAVNDAPVAVDDAAGTVRNVPLVLNAASLVANDADVDGDTLTITGVGNAVNGTVSLNAGLITFTPTIGYTGAARFDYTVSDGHGGTDTGTFAVNVAMPVVGGAPVLTAGNEVRVNTTTTGDQYQPAVAVLTGGGSVVVWTSSGLNDPTTANIMGRRYAADGSALGSEFVIANTTYGEEQPVVTALSDGGFAVAWQSNGQDGSGWGILGRSYDANGTARSAAFIMNATTAYGQYQPSIAALAGGGFMATWVSNYVGNSYIVGQRFDNSGTRVGAEYLINSSYVNTQYQPTVTGLTGGGYVVAWASNYAYGADNSDYGVVAQRFNASGATVGGTFQINTYVANAQDMPRLVGLADGGFVAVWESSGQDGSGYGIYGQRYDANCAKVGSEFLVNSCVTSDQTAPAVAAISGGGFVVTWTTVNQDGSGKGVCAQCYDANGVKIAGEVLVNTTTIGDQSAATVAVRPDGGIVTAWTSNGQDGSGKGVYANFDYTVSVSTGTLTVNPSVPVASGSVTLIAGNEVRVNTTTTGDQYQPAVAALTGGGSVVVWTSSGLNDPTTANIMGQRYAADGSALGSEFVIANTTYGEEQPVVTALSDGGFAVAWQSNGQDGSGWGILGRSYDANGTARSAAFIMNATTAYGQYQPSIAALAGGGYMATWVSNYVGNSYIVGQRFDNSGTRVGAEYLINSSYVNTQYQPTVTGLTGGGYVVAWASNYAYGADNSDYGVVAQRYDANGTKLGGTFQINTYVANGQDLPRLAGLADGGFVAVWESSGQDGYGYGVYGQRYDANGVKVGSEFPVSSYIAYDQTAPAVAATAGGGFVVTWTSSNQDGSGSGIVSQRYDANGIKIAGEVLVNTFLPSDQSAATVAVRPDGGIVTAWMSNGQDGSGKGVYAKLFAPSTQAPVVEANNATLVPGGQISAAALVSPGHVQGDGAIANGLAAFSYYQFQDNGAGGGYFTVNGVAKASGTPFMVTAADLGTVAFVGGSSAGSDAFQVRGFDGSQWSAWQNAAVVTQPTSQTLLAGPEVRVNTTTTGDQYQSSVVALAGGGSVVVWVSSGLNDETTANIMGQRYDAAGAAVGGEFVVTATGFSETQPSVTALSDGGFAVAWSSGGHDGNYAVFGRTFDASGTARSSEFNVNTSTSGAQYQPAVSALAGGGFIAVWDSVEDIYGQRFDNYGNRVGTEFLINTTTSGYQQQATVTGLSDGGFVTAWASSFGAADTSNYGVYGQRYDAAGTKVGTEFLINTYVANAQDMPRLAGLSNGGFVAVWESSGQDGSGYGVYGQRYDALGAKAGGEFLVNTATSGDQGAPAVASAPDGGFVVTWQSNGQDGAGLGVYGQRYDATGARTGGEFLVNGTTGGDQSAPSVAVQSGGGIVTAWTSDGQDGSGKGVYASLIAPVNLTGGAGNDTLFGGTGNDQMTGGAGNDLYMAGRGSGQDVIDNHGQGASADQLLFGAGIARDQLWLSHSGNDLVVGIIGTNDKVTIQDWYGGSANHVATIKTADGATLADGKVEALVSAMAQLTPPPQGQTTLSTQQHQALDAVIAANWQ